MLTDREIADIVADTADSVGGYGSLAERLTALWTFREHVTRRVEDDVDRLMVLLRQSGWTVRDIAGLVGLDRSSIGLRTTSYARRNGLTLPRQVSRLEGECITLEHKRFVK